MQKQKRSMSTAYMPIRCAHMGYSRTLVTVDRGKRGQLCWNGCRATPRRGATRGPPSHDLCPNGRPCVRPAMDGWEKHPVARFAGYRRWMRTVQGVGQAEGGLHGQGRPWQHRGGVHNHGHGRGHDMGPGCNHLGSLRLRGWGSGCPTSPAFCQCSTALNAQRLMQSLMARDGRA
jgi:hypothetical protein